MIGIVGFSNSALYGSKITKNREYTFAAIDAATGSSVNQTNIGSGITYQRSYLKKKLIYIG